MEMSDQDFELLGTYLDGELPVVQCEALWQRLAGEPALAAALEAQRRERVVRKQVWTALEPSDAHLLNLQKRLTRDARRHDAFTQAGRMARLVTTAAACIVFGFTIGWLGRDRISRPQAGDQSSGPYVVTVQDDHGQPIATQTFNSLQEAQNFAPLKALHAGQRITVIVDYHGDGGSH